MTTWHVPLATLWSGMESQLRVRAVALAVFCLAVTLMFATAGVPGGLWFATSASGIGGFGVSYLYARSLRRLVHDAQLSKLPRMGAYVLRANLAQLVIVGVAPAFLIVGLGGSELQFCAIGLAALLGLLVGTMSATFGVALVAASAVLMFLLRNPILELRQRDLSMLGVLASSTFLICLVRIWRVRLSSVPAQSVASDRTVLHRVHLLVAPDLRVPQGRLTPTAVIRSFMLPPYAPAGVAQRAMQAGVVFAMMCIPALLAFALGGSHALTDLRRAFHAFWPATVWFTGLLIWTWLLRSQILTFRGRSANLDELALLPAFGGAAMQRRHFFYASSIAPALLLPILIVLPLGSMLWDPESARIYVRIAFAFSLLPALLVFSWQLPGHRAFRQTWISTSVLGASQSFSVLYIGRGTLTAHQTEVFGLVFLTAWILVYVAAAVVLGFKRQWLADRPHPFVEMTP